MCRENMEEFQEGSRLELILADGVSRSPQALLLIVHLTELAAQAAWHSNFTAESTNTVTDFGARLKSMRETQSNYGTLQPAICLTY